MPGRGIGPPAVLGTLLTCLLVLPDAQVPSRCDGRCGIALHYLPLRTYAMLGPAAEGAKLDS
eukprot:1926394-Rhodomonas_salina.7